MKVSYDEKTDTLSVILKDNTPVAESDEDKPGVIGLICNGKSGVSGNSGRIDEGDRGKQSRLSKTG